MMVKKLLKKVADNLHSKNGIIYNEESIKASKLICELVRSGCLNIENHLSEQNITSELSWHMDMAYRSRSYLGNNRKKVISLYMLFNNISIQEKQSAVKIAIKELT